MLDAPSGRLCPFQTSRGIREHTQLGDLKSSAPRQESYELIERISMDLNAWSSESEAGPHHLSGLHGCTLLPPNASDARKHAERHG